MGRLLRVTPLEDVVRFYNEGGGQTGYAGVKSPMMVPLLLTEAEQRDLVELLEALTGEPPPEQLGMDTALHDP